MLSLVPESAREPTPQPYAEAVARLASIRHALRLVDPFGGGPAGDADDDAVAAAWEEAGDAKRRWFDRRSGQLVSATADGLETMLAARSTPHEDASRALVEEIRRELADVARVILD
jgi:hypothetical protein